MPVHRKTWTQCFTKSSIPPWPCPTCGVGTILTDDSTFHEGESPRSSKHHHEDFWEPTMYFGQFACLMRCNRPECKEVVSVQGESQLWEDWDRNGPVGYYGAYKPSSFSPAPPLIKLPEQCPEPIAKEVRVAFRLFWVDPPSCLNRIRVCVEMLLTELGVKQFDPPSNGKRRRLNLHERIEELRKKKPALGPLCDKLLAVKYLGNAGSHPGEIEADSVFDGFDILEHILHERFENRESVIAKMSREINRKKGPR